MAKLHKRHLRNSILFISLFIIVGILLVLFPLSYSIASNIMKRNAMVYTNQLLDQVKSSIAYYIDGMSDVSDFIAQDDDVLRYIGNRNPDTRASLEKKLETVVKTRPDFVNVIVFREDGDFVSSRKNMGLNPYWDYKEMSWYKNAVAAEGSPVFTSSRVENIVAGDHTWVISMSRALYLDGRLYGVLLIDLNYKQIADICSSLRFNDTGYIFIVGADGRLVYHPQQKLIYSGTKTERFDLVSRSPQIQSVTSEDGYMYTSSTLEKAGWVIVSVFDTNQLVPYGSDVVSFFAAVGAAFAVVATFFAYFSSKRLTDPILQLKSSMKKFEQGDLDAKANITVNNEVAELGESFNVMTEQIKKLIEQERLTEEQKRVCELQALQAQIRPHFLYNTLESIIWMSELGENEKVIEMTSALSKLFQATTTNAGELVPLRTEIDYVQNYMTIQKMRYQDKLNYRIDADPSVMEAKVTKLIIQPMVENAIYHGIKPRRDGGMIIVSAYPKDGKLYISIGDNGVGFDEASLREQFSLASSDENGIGISNVRERIRLFFGSEYGISIHSAPTGEVLPDEGTVSGMNTIVTLILPMIFE